MSHINEFKIVEHRIRCNGHKFSKWFISLSSWSGAGNFKICGFLLEDVAMLVCPCIHCDVYSENENVHESRALFIN